MRLNFRKTNKENIINSLKRINKAERNYLKIIIQNDPRNNISQVPKFKKEILDNLLKYYDLVLQKQNDFLNVKKCRRICCY
ncbi:MAG: hypothetical protein KC589_09790 [Nanoarchaeota archaeon]|nr:hypothetical protein [Nanoarchaeota archaeon]